jgi:hypothetical protein
MLRSPKPLVVVLSLLAPIALSRCDCVDPLSGIPIAQIEIVDDAGNSHLEADPWLAVDFGDADSGQQKARTLTLKNIGTGLMVIEGACLVNAADATAALGAPCIVGQTTAFTFLAPAGQTIKKGESLDVEVIFSPRTGGPASLFARFDSNAGDEPVVAVQLVGRGTDGRLCAEPNGIHDFGDVTLGTTAEGQITVRNCGVKPVTITELTFAQNPDSAFAFSIAGGASPVGQALAEDESFVLDVAFTPQQPGPYRDTRAGDIRVVTAAPFEAQYDLILLGNGVVPPSCKVNVIPDVLNFNAVASGTTATRQIIIQSVGQCGCTIDAITDPTPASAGFVLGALPALPFALKGTIGCEGDPAGSATAPTNLIVDVVYTSPVRDIPVADNASLEVTTSDLVEPVQTVQLQANGGGAPFCQLDVTPVQGSAPIGFQIPAQGRYGVVEFGRTSVHVPKRLPITLTNVGNAPCDVTSLDYDKRENTLQNEFSLETEAGAPAIPAAPFSVTPGQTRTFFAVFSPTHTIQSNGIFDFFNFGSYSAGIPPNATGFELAVFCGGNLNGPNARCNGVTFVTNDTTTDVSSSDRPAGTFSIGFAGTPVEPLVDVIPGELDFGLVTLDCGSPLQRVTVYNNGGAELVVNEPFIDPIANPVVFRVEGTTNPTNTWPFAVQPGGSLSVQVRYFARQLGLQSANLVIPTREGGEDGPPVLIPLRGTGTTETSQTDIFDQFRDPKVDVLWVIDDSGSMAPFQQQLAANFNQFFVASRIIDADFHIAVTTTLTADANCIGAPPTCQTNAQCGAGGQCQFGFCTAGSGAVNQCDDDPKSGWYTSCIESEHYLTPATVDPESRFTCNVQVSNDANVNPNRPGSDSAEGGLRAAYKFLSPPNITDPAINGGFLRDDAKLHVIMVSDEPEQSKGGVDQYIDFFKNVKGFRNEGLVAVSAIAAPPNGCTYNGGTLQDSRYKAVVDEMNGRFQEICNPDWTGMMSQLGLDSLGLRVEFFLTRAAEPSTIQVCVRSAGAGSPCANVAPGVDGGSNGWFYDAGTNSVVFNVNSVPPRGSRVEISYGTFCFGP